MKFIVTILVSFFATDLFIWWSGIRILKRISARRGFIVTFHLFMAFQILSQVMIVFARTQGMNIDAMLPMPLMIATFIWHLTLAPIALVLNLLELAREAIVALIRYIRSRKKEAAVPVSVPESSAASQEAEPLPAATEPPDGPLPVLGLTRRDFLSATVALAPPLFTISISAIASEQIQRFRIRRLTATLPQLPPELDGVTIAHLSDTHAGRFSRGEVLTKISEATNALKPDLVVFTGDLINDSLEWLPDALEMLKRIDNRVFVCEGNHDLIIDPFEFRTRLKSTPDLTLLVNESHTINFRGVPIQFLGLCWEGPYTSVKRRWNEEYTLTQSTQHLRRMRNRDAFQIMLAHHPHAWDYMPDVPLTFAGHTHGGQLMLNEKLGVGPLMFRYWTGIYNRPHTDDHSAGSLVVSNGVGNWFPLRVSAPAEIVHLTLRRGV
jgi:predicted MPP superfamily phosphohydrolase